MAWNALVVEIPFQAIFEGVLRIASKKVKVLEYKHYRDGVAFINFGAPAV
jgi:hypothetical protein